MTTRECPRCAELGEPCGEDHSVDDRESVTWLESMSSLRLTKDLERDGLPRLFEVS